MYAIRSYYALIVTEADVTEIFRRMGVALDGTLARLKAEGIV